MFKLIFEIAISLSRMVDWLTRTPANDPLPLVLFTMENGSHGTLGTAIVDGKGFCGMYKQLWDTYLFKTRAFCETFFLTGKLGVQFFIVMILRVP